MAPGIHIPDICTRITEFTFSPRQIPSLHPFAFSFNEFPTDTPSRFSSIRLPGFHCGAPLIFTQPAD